MYSQNTLLLVDEETWNSIYVNMSQCKYVSM